MGQYFSFQAAPTIDRSVNEEGVHGAEERAARSRRLEDGAGEGERPNLMRGGGGAKRTTTTT
eukprot:4366755-Pyramimonas_sp.AAC.1